MFNGEAVIRRVFKLDTVDPHRVLTDFVKPYLRYFPLIAALGFVTSVLEGLGIGLLIPFLSLLTGNSTATILDGPLETIFEIFGLRTIPSRLVGVGFVALAVILLKGALQAVNGILMVWVDGQLGRDLRATLARRILRLDFEFFLRNDNARLVQIISADSWRVSEAVYAILAFLPAALALAVFASLLALLDLRLCLITLAGALAIRIWMGRLEKRVKRLSAEVTASNHALGHRMLDIVAAIRVVRIFGQQEREERRFVSYAERVRRAMLATQGQAAWIKPAIDVMISLLFVGIVLASYAFGVTLAVVSAFVLLLARSQPHARTVSEARIKIASVRGSIDEVSWLLAQQPRKSTALGLQPPAMAPVEFDRVSFRYPDGNRALDEVSFTIRPGVATALIGPSGSGKSTIINLLCKLIEPESGVIRVGDCPLSAIDGPAWCSRVAIAGQDIDIVEATIAENIAYGRPDASAAEIAEAARTAGADAFIAALPDGYQSRVGQLGIRLSGGQRQRIGIARAMLCEPELLILDEATSAVDAMSEREIIRLLAEHRHFRTALVVSHRRSTLAACTEGIVLEQGRIVEAGPLQELDYYANMSSDQRYA